MDDQNKQQPSVSISVGNISANGSVAIGGQDATVYVNTGGNVDQSKYVVIGGVQATREKVESLSKKIDDLEKNTSDETIPEEKRQLAAKAINLIRSQLLSKNKPDMSILLKAGHFLKKLSPALAGAVLSVFFDPLVVEIIHGMGAKAGEYLQQLQRLR